MNRYKIILATASILLTVLFSCSPGRGKDRHAGNHLRVLTHNVWYGFSKVPERKQNWIAWIQEQNADVVCLQELNGYTPELLAEDARSYGHEYSVLLKEEGFPTGITSRLPMEDVRRVREGFHHGLLRVRISQIYIYVIHLHPSSWESRKSEINLILKDIASLPADSKVILAGDFNTFSPLDSLYYKDMSLEHFFSERDRLYGELNLNAGKLDYSVIRELMNFGFIDLEAGVRTSSYVFSGSFPTKVEKEGEHGEQRRLDYIFTSQNLAGRAAGAKIIATDATLGLSDHLPVIADLDLDH